MKAHDQRSAFSLVELIVIVAAVAVICGVFLSARSRRNEIAPIIRCVNNLKNIGLAFRIFSTDNGDRHPQELLLSNGVKRAALDVFRVYLTLSNALSTPKILYCPADKSRGPAESFTNFNTKNISYFASLSATELTPTAFLAGDRNLQTNGVPVSTGILAISTNSAVSWSKEIHIDQGNVAMGDGSVQQFNSRRLMEATGDQQLETNYLAMP